MLFENTLYINSVLNKTSNHFHKIQSFPIKSEVNNGHKIMSSEPVTSWNQGNFLAITFFLNFYESLHIRVHWLCS